MKSQQVEDARNSVECFATAHAIKGARRHIRKERQKMREEQAAAKLEV